MLTPRDPDLAVARAFVDQSWTLSAEQSLFDRPSSFW